MHISGLKRSLEVIKYQKSVDFVIGLMIVIVNEIMIHLKSSRYAKGLKVDIHSQFKMSYVLIIDEVIRGLGLQRAILNRGHDATLTGSLDLISRNIKYANPAVTIVEPYIFEGQNDTAELAALMQEAGKIGHVVVCTGLSRATLTEQYGLIQGTHFSHYQAKPIDTEDIVAAVQDYL